MLIIGERRNVKPDYRDEANSLCGMRSVKYELACSCVTVTASHRVAIANKETSYIDTLVPFFVTMSEEQPALKRFVRDKANSAHVALPHLIPIFGFLYV